VNDGGGDGAGCFDIKEWVDTTELMNVEEITHLFQLPSTTSVGLRRLLVNCLRIGNARLRQIKHHIFLQEVVWQPSEADTVFPRPCAITQLHRPL